MRVAAGVLVLSVKYVFSPLKVATLYRVACLPTLVQSMSLITLQPSIRSATLPQLVFRNSAVAALFLASEAASALPA